jgi:hypothetical protein
MSRAVFHIDIQTIKTGSANEWTDINGARLAQAHAQRHFACGEPLFEFVFHLGDSCDALMLYLFNRNVGACDHFGPECDLALNQLGKDR